MAISELVRGLRDLVFPPVCLICHSIVAGSDDHFCAACTRALTDDPHSTCPRCSSSVGEFADVSKGCPSCRNDRFHFDSCFRMGPYDGILREAVLRMKSGTGEMLADCLGHLWARHLEKRFREVGASVVIPVPLHWWRKWRRGFNQSESLADAIARHLGLPCEPQWLQRIRHTPHQTGLAATERRANMRGAFRAAKSADLKNKIVLLIDDVLTTGSTASAAASALRDAGAARTVVAILAHRG